MQAKKWPIGGRIRHWKSFISEALWLTWCTCYKNSVTFWTNANINMCVPLPLTDIQQGLLDICAGYMKTGKSCTKKRSTHSLRGYSCLGLMKKKKKRLLQAKETLIDYKTKHEGCGSQSNRDPTTCQDAGKRAVTRERREREMWSVKKVWVIREKKRYNFDEKPPAFPWSLPTERGVKTWACSEMCKSQVK